MSESDALVEDNVCKHLLNDTWILYAHLPHDTDWTLNSYKQILKISSAEEIQNCMLFLMRKHIKPIWEDENNKNGGCFSYKINNKYVSDIWRKLSCLLVGESLINEKMTNKVNGITISPKKHFCIIKIWMKDCSIQNPDVINYFEGISSQGSLFKKHIPQY
jgi:hypothetical protein